METKTAVLSSDIYLGFLLKNWTTVLIKFKEEEESLELM